MKANELFDIHGCDNRIIPAVLWGNTKAPAKKLAILFPGYRYPAEGPLTFYLKILFHTYGFDILSLDYRYHENRAFLALRDEEKDQYFENDQHTIYSYIR